MGCCTSTSPSARASAPWVRGPCCRPMRNAPLSTRHSPAPRNQGGLVCRAHEAQAVKHRVEAQRSRLSRQRARATQARRTSRPTRWSSRRSCTSPCRPSSSAMPTCSSARSSSPGCAPRPALTAVPGADRRPAMPPCHPPPCHPHQAQACSQPPRVPEVGPLELCRRATPGNTYPP